jgi:hypothetical protein
MQLSCPVKLPMLQTTAEMRPSLTANALMLQTTAEMRPSLTAKHSVAEIRANVRRNDDWL